MPVLALILVMLLAQIPAWAGAAPAANTGIDAFFGTYRGHAPAGADTRAAPRDLSVTIGPAADGGFVVGWTTIARGEDGRETAKSYSIAFRPTQRPGVYRSAMRANVFGERVPLDPFSGDPFFWARLSGNTLSVFALIILNDGGYDLQIYDRTLNKTGLDLVFSRWVDRQQVAEVRAQLTRVAD